jgi:hypothetical protein
MRRCALLVVLREQCIGLLGHHVRRVLDGQRPALGDDLSGAVCALRVLEAGALCAALRTSVHVLDGADHGGTRLAFHQFSRSRTSCSNTARSLRLMLWSGGGGVEGSGRADGGGGKGYSRIVFRGSLGIDSSPQELSRGWIDYPHSDTRSATGRRPGNHKPEALNHIGRMLFPFLDRSTPHWTVEQARETHRVGR